MGFLKNRRLSRNGVAASATVVGIRQHEKTATNDWRRYDLILDVEVPGRAVFRTETHEQLLIGGLNPKAGDVLRVTVDPEGDDVRLELSGDPRYDLKARRAQSDERYQDLLQQPPAV